MPFKEHKKEEEEATFQSMHMGKKKTKKKTKNACGRCKKPAAVILVSGYVCKGKGTGNQIDFQYGGQKCVIRETEDSFVY